MWNAADNEDSGVPGGYAFAKGLLVALILILLDLWWGGPLARIDVRLSAMAIGRDSELRTPLLVPDGVGLRAVTAPILLLMSGLLGWRLRTWRPVWLATGSVVALNLTVAAIKIAVGRGKPIDGNPDLFVGGMMWPSGHASNIAMTMTLGLYMLRRYAGIGLSSRAKRWVFAVPTSIMCTTSLVCGYHWLSDLIAGVIVGFLVAAVAGEIDGRLLAAHRPVAKVTHRVTASPVPAATLRSPASSDAGERSAMV